MKIFEVTCNKMNWSGEFATVQYTEDGRFHYAGMNFQVGEFVPFESEILKGEGCRVLTGNEWTEPLTELHVANDSLERAIVRAVQWIANNV